MFDRVLNTSLFSCLLQNFDGSIIGGVHFIGNTELDHAFAMLDYMTGYFQGVY